MTSDIFTLEEVACRLRLPGKERTIAKVARRNGLCMMVGREYRFTERDVEEIKEALRCPSSSPAVKAPTTGTSGAPSEDKAFSNLVELATVKRQKQSASKRKRGY